MVSRNWLLFIIGQYSSVPTSILHLAIQYNIFMLSLYQYQKFNLPVNSPNYARHYEAFFLPVLL